jgi:pyrroloquinoline-quinone synthase
VSGGGGEPLAPAELERRLRRIGEERYHHRHPWNLRMHAGELAPDELRGWVRNRYYYQTRIPVKDGMILAKSGEATFRREWIQRIRDHDGERAGEGGLELWLRLAEAVGLERGEVERCERVLPGVRRACDAYVEFVAGHDLLESVASSLTELFAGDIMRARIAAFEKHYPWVDADGLRYFRTRTVQAPRDAGYGLAFVLEHARTRADQERAERALVRKCEILWSLLDAVADAFRRPRLAPAALLRRDAADGAQVVLPERLVRLDERARGILALCDGTRSAEAIATLVRERGGGEPAIEADVHEFLGEIRRLGVLAD